ncbi:MAG TPA: hypothetical protein VFV08_17035 [Puia sp.]|nr:hypothetical protein [Puia sp.]
MYNPYISKLIVKYRNRALSKQEQVCLENWVNESHDNRLLFDKLTNEEYIAEKLAMMKEIASWAPRNPFVRGWRKVLNFFTS